MHALYENGFGSDFVDAVYTTVFGGDTESEKIVQKSMEKLAKNRTTLVIAHRLSTIRNAKKILVLTENGIEEQGTHEELMEKQGIYYDLYKLTKL